MELDHINIKAPKEKLDELRDFYCDALGLTDGFRPEFNSAGYWLYSEEKAFIHLTEGNEGLEKSSGSHLDHFAVRKQGLDKFLGTLAEYDIRASIQTANGGEATQVFFFDPCGLRVEVCFYGEFCNHGST